MLFWKELDWEILGLVRFLNQERELFFFGILKPKKVVFSVKFSAEGIRQFDFRK